jgi:hypothetical protein
VRPDLVVHDRRLGGPASVDDPVPGRVGGRHPGERLRMRQYTRERGDDAPDIKNWTWPF